MPSTAVSGNVDLTLYGPADVIGIDPRLVVRTDPKPNTTNFEPNYLAIVDFDPPDFPWLLTPAQANAQRPPAPVARAVVLERAKVRPPALKPGRPLPSISLTADAGRDRAARSRRIVAVGARAGRVAEEQRRSTAATRRRD